MGDDRLDLEFFDEVLLVILMDFFEQLDFVRKIILMVIVLRVLNLDFEVVELRQKFQGKEIVVCEFEEKVFCFERDCCEVDLRLKIVFEENVR